MSLKVTRAGSAAQALDLAQEGMVKLTIQQTHGFSIPLPSLEIPEVQETQEVRIISIMLQVAGRIFNVAGKVEIAMFPLAAGFIVC